MSSYVMLREYLRACYRARKNPGQKIRKKIAYLKFMGAHLCPECGEEIDPSTYRRHEMADKEVVEAYHCSGCATGYTFPRGRFH